MEQKTQKSKKLGSCMQSKFLIRQTKQQNSVSEESNKTNEFLKLKKCNLETAMDNYNKHVPVSVRLVI